MPGDELGQTEAATPGTTPPQARPPGEEPRAGDTVGRYVIERVLGAGGMGVVFAAHDPDLDRRVALKLLHANVAGAGPEARTRLLREARAMAKVNHANVITVYEVGTANGVDFVAMELVEGTNLADWLRSTRRPTEEILRVFRAAGRGLAAAHATGLVHRDFKPANVLVSHRGKVVVTDFGLARAFEGPDAPLAVTLPSSDPAPTPPPPTAALDETLDAGGNTPGASNSAPRSSSRTGSLRGDSADLSSTITRTGALLGTPAYMSPEQFRGQTACPRADQYAYAVALWEGLAGGRPFRGTSFEELKQAVERGDAADVERIPRRLRPVLIRGMARSLDDRYRNMDEMLEALERAERPAGRRIAAIALAALLVLGGILLLLMSGGTSRPAAPAAAACAISDADLETAWSPAIAADLGKRLASHASWPALRDAIDRHAGEWRAERKATCAEPAARDYHGRVACLMSMRDELAAITQMLPGLPPEALRGGSLAEVLAAPASCRTGAAAARPPLPDDPAILAELSEIQREGALAGFAARSGNAAAARARATEAVARARKLGDLVGLASALQNHGTVEHVLGNCEAAEPLYADAATIADSANAGGLRAMSKIGYLECYIKRSSDLVKLRMMATEAEAAVKGAGNDARLRAVLDSTLVDLDLSAGDLDGAITRAESAREVFTDLKDARRAGVTARRLADLYLLRGDLADEDRSVALRREAVALAEATFGDEHRQTQLARRALASVLLQRDPEEARAVLATIHEQPEDHPTARPRMRARGRVLLPDGSPAAGARVYLGPLLIATDNGLPIELEFIGDKPTVLVTDGDGRYDGQTFDDSIGMAALGELRTPVFKASTGEQTVKLGTGIDVDGTITVRRGEPPPADVERIAHLATRTTLPGAVVLGATAHTIGYQVFARGRPDGSWSVRTVPPNTPLRAGGGIGPMLGDRPVVMQTLPPATGGRAHADLVLDLTGPVLEVIVRADRAAIIPTAQVMVFGGKLSPLPRNGEGVAGAVAKAPYWNVAFAIGVHDSTRTRAAAELYQAGDIHARFSSVQAGANTICVIPFSGDAADESFLRQLMLQKDIEVRCQVFDIPARPWVQAIVIETPPAKRMTIPGLPPPPSPGLPPPPPPPRP